MRHFVVLGFKTASKSERGNVVHFGTNCAKAMDEVKAPSTDFARKELYELAIPSLRKSGPSPAEKAAAEAKAKEEAEKAAAEAKAKEEAEKAAAEAKEKKKAAAPVKK